MHFPDETATSSLLANGLSSLIWEIDACVAFIEGCRDLTFGKTEATGPHHLLPHVSRTRYSGHH